MERGLATTMAGGFIGEYNLLPLSISEEEAWYRIFMERIRQQEIRQLEKAKKELEEKIKKIEEILGIERIEEDYDY
jgi:hypothetical protein